MFTCPVCHSQDSCEELVDEVFLVDGRYALVGGIPAVVCVRCGEQAFSRETTEKVRLMVQGDAESTTSIPLHVFDFA